jgi:hypothetical protein
MNHDSQSWLLGAHRLLLILTSQQLGTISRVRGRLCIDRRTSLFDLRLQWIMIQWRCCHFPRGLAACRA